MARCLATCVLLLTACVTDGLPGPTGQRGPAGPRGERGPAGPTAASYRPAAWVSCAAAIDLIATSASGLARAADGVAETSLSYTVMGYANDDVDVQCSAGIGTAQSGSSGMYYPAPTRGAMYATCFASADYPSTGGGRDVGYWTFELDGNELRARYTDSDNPLGLDGYVHTFAESSCRAFVMVMDGSWLSVSVADVF